MDAKKTLHICYATDNNFALQTAVSIISLAENAFGYSIFVHLLDAGLSEENYKKIVSLCGDLCVNLVRYDIRPYLELVRKSGQKAWGDFPSHATWARLFLPEILPSNIEKVLYLDGDAIAAKDFTSIFDIDLNGNTIAAVEDCVAGQHKRDIGLSVSSRYVNAGIILFDLTAWRKTYTTDWLRQYLTGSIRYPMADQDVINLMFEGQCLYLPLKYNFSSWFRALDIQPLKHLLQDEHFCHHLQEDVKRCKNEAIFIHYNSCSLLVRPWYRDATDPATHIWANYYQKSPWLDALTQEPEHLSPNERKDRALYRIVGKRFFEPIHRLTFKLNDVLYRRQPHTTTKDGGF